VENNTERQVIY